MQIPRHPIHRAQYNYKGCTGLALQPKQRQVVNKGLRNQVGLEGTGQNGLVRNWLGHHWEHLYLGASGTAPGTGNKVLIGVYFALNLVTITMDAFGTGLGYFPRKIHTGNQQNQYKMEPGS